MERQYVGIRTFGNPMDILNRVRRVVQQDKLTRTIPAVKWERKSQRKSRGEFYLFLAVEGTDGVYLPDTVATALRLSGLATQHFWPLKPDDIKSMVGSAEIETHSLNALIYKSLWCSDTGDPFDLADAPIPEGDAEDSGLGECYDRLLYWLSANAEGTWQAFAHICKVLHLADDTKLARYILRRLILLGHIECSGDGLRWSICPSALVRSPVDTSRFFLSGQRTPKFLEQLEGCWELENVPQPEHQGPACIKASCEFLVEDIVKSLEGNIAIEWVGVASVRMAELLPDLGGWKEILPSIDRISTANYEIEKWDGEQYVLCDELYERGGQYFGESGMYRLTRRGYSVNLYFDQPTQRWLKGDWYGLRFLAHHTAGVDLEVVYNTGANALLVPNEERWPLLYERALVLSSGILPSHADNPKWLRYQGVSAELCQNLAEKLKVSIKEVYHE